MPWSSTQFGGSAVAEAVQFPNQQANKFPCPGIRHDAVSRWSAGLSAAGNVLVEFCYLPASARGGILDFAPVEFIVLIGGADARINRCFSSFALKW